MSKKTREEILTKSRKASAKTNRGQDFQQSPRRTARRSETASTKTLQGRHENAENRRS